MPRIYIQTPDGFWDLKETDGQIQQPETLIVTDISDDAGGPGSTPTTKFYLCNRAPVYTPPTIRGTWDKISSPGLGALDRSKADGGQNTAKELEESTATNPFTVLVSRFISGPLAGQTITGTLNLIAGLREDSDTCNFHYALHVYVTQGATDTVRGTLINNFRDDLHEWLAGGNKGWDLSAPQTMPDLLITEGDRLVVEVGFVSRNVFAGFAFGRINYGTVLPSGVEMPDITVGSILGTSEAGYITFSNPVLELGPRVDLSHIAMEEIVLPEMNPEARLSHIALEVMVLTTSELPARLSHIALEVLYLPESGTKLGGPWLGGGGGTIWIE